MRYHYHYLQATTSEGRMVFDAEPEALERLNAPGIFYAHVFEGGAAGCETPEAVANVAFSTHNRDDRPRGQEVRSMSVGDVVVVADSSVFYCANLGWKRLEGQAAEQLRRIANRRAHGMVATRHLAEALENAGA